jgi:phosphate-selective porin OprO/OprP
MHGRIQVWLARTLAVAIGCGACAVAQAQGYLPTNTGYPESAYSDTALADNQMAVTNTSTALSEDAAQADLAQRVADLEKALKKADAKAKDDKKKADSAPSVKLGGVMAFDGSIFTVKNAATQALAGPPGSGEDAFQNGFGARRLRLFVSGEAFSNTDYMVDVDFGASTGRPTFKNVYFTIKELPYVQNVRFGHLKEPFGLEQQTSDLHTTFIERSMCDVGFMVPAYNNGLMMFGNSENEKASFAIGAFINQSGVDDPPMYAYNVIPGAAAPQLPTGATYATDAPQTAVTMRGSWTPWYDEATQGRGLLHVGSGYSYRSDLGYHNAARNTVLAKNYAVRPENWLAPVILNTNALPAVSNQLVNFETAFVYGPLSFQSEVFANYIQQPGDTSVTFGGAYAYVSYFLTGENRVYNRKSGCFTRVRPYTNFFRVRTCEGDVETGLGAWEVGYRISYVDMLGDIPIASRTVGLGRATDHTFGVNWYLNPNAKLMFNYVITSFDRVDAGTTLTNNHTVNGLEMRAQFDF